MKNEVFDEAKDKVAEYEKLMQETYESFLEEIKELENPFRVEDTDEGEVKKMKKFCRTWEIMNNKLTVSDKNILLVMGAYNQKYDEVLACFNGRGSKVKNLRTLQVMVCQARKRVRDFYNKEYGNI